MSAAAPASVSAAEALWERQQAANAANYAGLPLHSCSVQGHRGAEAFGWFLYTGGATVCGRALDVGCGPQSLPLYLRGFALDWVAGIDPLPPAAEPHPFEFVQGRAEALPWPAGEFMVAVAATSLDHMVDPALVVAEIRRVLLSRGRFFIWATFWPDAVPYDPAYPPAELVDGCHAYHLGPWFREVLARRFSTVREQASPANPNDTFLELVPQ